MLYEFLSERLENDSRPLRTTESVAFPLARQLQDALRPADLVPLWRGPPLTDTPRLGAPYAG
jgi:hypothetical protein